MNFTEMNSIFDDMNKILSRINELRIKTLGTMNIAEIMNRHHLEDQHSNIIAFLINPSQIHNHPEFGELFLKSLKAKGLKINGNRILRVVRENLTDDLRRMDIFIQTDSDYIIIENKVKASDLNNQITDYIRHIKEKYELLDDPFVVYLTIFGTEPLESSISREHLQQLKQTNHFISLSYSNDMIDWLKRLKTKENEDVLNAAIIQYIDVVKAISNQREETFNMNQEIVKELFMEYGKLTREELKNKLNAVYIFQNNIHLVLFINFFRDIFKEGKGKIHLLCSGKIDYQNISEWEQDVLNRQERFGIRYYFDNGDMVDFFVRNLNDKKFIVAGNNKDWVHGGTYPIEEEGYDYAGEFNQWILNAICNTSEWEEGQGRNLSTHIVRNWFEIN